MLIKDLKNKGLENEFVYEFSRSSGPGGQNVNKVSTRVELRFNIINTEVFNSDEKKCIIKKLGKQITKEGDILVTSQTTRSQSKNREDAAEKMYLLLYSALLRPKKRYRTRPNAASIKKRLENKRKLAEKKHQRRNLI
ncbi:MAG: aminoacyl-tRNA hydrolase [Bacteroidales bacterium]|nr:aminoacyl-tRNA hydrolase [Bacteroidales bacterium]